MSIRADDPTAAAGPSAMAWATMPSATDITVPGARTAPGAGERHEGPRTETGTAPTGAAVAAADATAPTGPAAAAPTPVHGRYRGAGAGFELELRVDIDGSRPLHKLSGDVFATSGATTGYFGSFVVHAVAVTRTPDHVVVTGEGEFGWAARYPVVRVVIPLVPGEGPRAAATVQFLDAPRRPGASYLCPFVSPYFRTVQWEQDSVVGKVPFVSYDTGSLPLPPGTPARTLTVPAAYADAGLELMSAGTPNVLAENADGWTDGELHGAMCDNFSLWKDLPQWKVWLLVAGAYEGNPGVRGIMFDYHDTFQRQGCAVFYDAIKGTDPDAQRSQLRTYVHELGHAFNLMHSWQKNLSEPPAPLGPNQGFGDLSWMNYPHKYNPGGGAPSGDAAYWANFPFRFTDDELAHLRHGFYRDVVMGAGAFGAGARDIAPELFEEPIADESGLRLELRAKPAHEFGEPVVVELKLRTTDLRGRTTHAFLHPNNDLVSIAIRQPSGRTVVFRPLMRRCVDEDLTVRLDTSRPAVYTSAYIGYGRDGHYFQQPGRYTLRAVYLASDGSRVVSPALRLTVRHPQSRTDEHVAELMMGEEQGTLLALLGSDSPALRAGNDALQEVVERHAKHPLSVYARMVKGLNAERDFKSLGAGRRLTVRPADTKEGIQQLAPVVDASVQGKGLDNITLTMVMCRLARAEARQGDLEQAHTVLDRMTQHFSGQRLTPHVVDAIRAQAEATKADLAAAYGA
ncbi:hypothetical protein [Streptomyces sp. URMC 123]|uniref:hypothetical protein n=1 Tax=Streptomyces sp. URMC 123 TaxID=3423403 RepID=UPI003F1B72EC